MHALKGLAAAFVFFAVSFALHIVGGATDQSWLFAIAVALIFVAATGFPAIALLAAGPGTSIAERRVVLGAGFAAGLLYTAGALWAANDRSFAWWHAPAAVALVLAVSAALLALAHAALPPGRRPAWPVSAPASR
ncbi:MAG: hypothetical protein ACM3S1_14595 [Hyphomicrobiales bacterium]